MKRVLPLSLCMLVLFCLAGCVGKSDSFENDISEEIVDNDTESQTAVEALEKTEIPEELPINLRFLLLFVQPVYVGIRWYVKGWRETRSYY